jgi:hypothetical protein
MCRLAGGFWDEAENRGTAPVSRPGCLKAELPSCVQQLAVARNEGSTFRPARTPSQGGGQLEGVCGSEREAVDEALGLIAKGLTWGYLAPFGAQFIENHLGLDMPV